MKNGTGRIAVILLGAITLAVIGGATWLLSTGNNVPGEMWTIASAAAGGLVGVLYPQRVDSDSSTDDLTP